MTSPTAFAGTPLRSRPPLAAATPRSAAERVLSAPPNFPIGVLTAPAITMLFVIGSASLESRLALFDVRGDALSGVVREEELLLQFSLEREALGKCGLHY